MFFCGDFMDPTIKENQVMLKWAMNNTFISMKKIFELGSQEEKDDLVKKSIMDVVALPQKDGYLNYYPFDDMWITHQKFNWE